MGEAAQKLDDMPAPRSAAAQARLRAMFESHYAFVWRILRRLGVDGSEVDDAAQQVFYVATCKIDRIDQGQERSFLLGVAVNLASEARRKRAIGRERPSDQLDDEPNRAPTPEQLTDRKRALELLDVVLEQIPFELRTVFVLFEIERMSMQEIAEMLALPRGTVASRLRRAREEFSEITKRERAKRSFRRTEP